MRQLATTILLIFAFLVGFNQPSFCAIKGRVQYSIPTDYSKLSETELRERAIKYYYLAQKLKDGQVNEDMTNALNLYTALQNINPENIDYCVKLGILYDKIGKDRYAKGNFFRAAGINPDSPIPYFYLGEFYYKRALYKNALKYYKKAYERTPGTNYEISYKLGDIYEKLGDTRTALKYLNEANIQNPNPELDSKIKQVNSSDMLNSKYYSK